MNREAAARDALRSTTFPNVSLIPAGASPPNAAELLASARMREVLDELGELADIVIIDSPPVLGVSDPVILAATGGAGMLVVQSGVTRPRSLLRARDALLKTDAVLLGAVINAARPRVTAEYYGDYAYGGRAPDSTETTSVDPSERV